MAWKETCLMDERMAMIGSWVSGDYAVRELAAQYGVSRFKPGLNEGNAFSVAGGWLSSG
jgi:hypothetical protein